MEVIGSLYTEVSDAFQKGIKKDYARCIKAEKHDLGVVLMNDISPVRLGNLFGCDKGTGFAGNVWDKDFISSSLTTSQGGYRQPMIVTESTVVAMRGRNPENPSDRTAGNPTEQSLEMNTQGTCNCLTSVQKDNLVMETVKIKQATKNGYAECKVGGVFDASYPESGTRRGRVQDGGNTCPTITAQNQELCHIQPNYRIRKLTPMECGRLMGVSDEDISKMAAVNSNTQLYKQFGNSIVVDVMVAMFKNLGIEQKGTR